MKKKQGRGLRWFNADDVIGMELCWKILRVVYRQHTVRYYNLNMIYMCSELQSRSLFTKLFQS
jgi:hypothetical protein